MSFDIESFKHIKKEDFKNIFNSSQYGIMVKFRTKLKEWQHSNVSLKFILMFSKKKVF